MKKTAEVAKEYVHNFLENCGGFGVVYKGAEFILENSGLVLIGKLRPWTTSYRDGHTVSVDIAEGYEDGQVLFKSFDEKSIYEKKQLMMLREGFIPLSDALQVNNTLNLKFVSTDPDKTWESITGLYSASCQFTTTPENLDRVCGSFRDVERWEFSNVMFRPCITPKSEFHLSFPSEPRPNSDVIIGCSYRNLGFEMTWKTGS